LLTINLSITLERKDILAMNHLNCEGRFVTEFGCGCNKGKVANATQPAVRRVTVYQVMQGTEMVAEFQNLQEARAKATEVGGRVKVSSTVA
jgi:hypothetical protein